MLGDGGGGSMLPASLSSLYEHKGGNRRVQYIIQKRSLNFRPDWREGSPNCTPGLRVILCTPLVPASLLILFLILIVCVSFFCGHLVETPFLVDLIEVGS